MPFPRRMLCVVVGLLVIPSLTHAYTWTQLNQPVTNPSAMLVYLQSHGESLGLGAHLQTKIGHITPIRGGSVVRVTAHHNGYPVLNRGLSAVILGNRLVAISGQKAGSPATTGFQLTLELAKQRVTDRVKAVVRGGVKGYWSRGGQLHPVWALDVFRSTPIGIWRVVVDANNGNVLSATSRLISAFGNAYTPNPSVGAVNKVELQGLSQPGELVGEYADVSSCQYAQSGASCKRHAVPDATSGDFLYAPLEPSFKDPFSEVHAYYHVDAFHRWLYESFGFKRKGDSQQIRVMVNMGFESAGNIQSMSNAFFGDMDGDGKGELVFGQGKRDFAYDADVVYHEFTHSAVDETSDLQPDIDELGFNMMPLALNEAFADLFSCAYAGDPKVGEYAGGSQGIRNLIGSASCPKGMMGESHQDGLMWGQACWSVRQQVKDTAVFDDVLYKTMVGLDKNAGFADAVKLFLKIAQVTDPALATLATAEFTSRGLDSCSRVVPLEEGDVFQGFVMGVGSAPGMAAIPGPMQYKIEVPQTASELTVNVNRLHGWGASTIGAYVRKGSPVSFATSKPVYDFVVSNDAGSITLGRDDPKNKLEAGATYYVIPLNIGSDDTLYRITMGMTLEEPPVPDAAPQLEPDAGVPQLDSAPTTPAVPDDPQSGGCSCEVSSGPGASALPLLLTLCLALALLRRRPR